MNNKITTDIISTTGINITKYDILPAKVFINGVEVTDTESWNKAISTFSELQDKINNLQSKIDKATKKADELRKYIYRELVDFNVCGSTEAHCLAKDLLDILKEAENVENN
ncbi:hypothetical protein J6P59_00540 [bacterium]|nr:hypothetical protein [bacterium]MBO7611058.1 hypothetical protein [Elusimicrobiota bacterium]